MLLPTALSDRGEDLFLLRFLGDLGWRRGSSALDYLESGDVAHYAVPESFCLGVHKISHDLLVRLIIGRELFRIACNQLSGNLLHSCYPNFPLEHFRRGADRLLVY